jgi:hypothetical protein
MSKRFSNTLFGCMNLSSESGNLEFGPPIQLFGCVWNLGVETEANSERGSLTCKQALLWFGGRPLGIPWKRSRPRVPLHRHVPLARELVTASNLESSRNRWSSHRWAPSRPISLLPLHPLCPIPSSRHSRQVPVCNPPVSPPLINLDRPSDPQAEQRREAANASAWPSLSRPLPWTSSSPSIHADAQVCII